MIPTRPTALLLSSSALHAGALAGAILCVGTFAAHPEEPARITLRPQQPTAWIELRPELEPVEPFEVLPPPPATHPEVTEAPVDPESFRPPEPDPDHLELPSPPAHRSIEVPVQQRIVPPSIDAAVVETEALPDAPHPAEPPPSLPNAFVDAEPIESLNDPPAYPRLAIRRGWQGVVWLEVEIDLDGRVAAARIAQSSGRAVLDRAALDAVLAWQFRPAQRAGAPTSTTLDLPIEFELRDG